MWYSYRMGMRRTTNQDLPPRMLRKVRRGVVRYYYATKGSDRKEIPLGPTLKGALEKYKIIVASEEIGTVPVPSDIYSDLFKKMCKSARTRGIPVHITADDVRDMVELSKYKCSVSGIKFDMRKVEGMRIRPWMPSIDRIDPSKPYARENCRVVCAAVNLALNQFGDDVFFIIAKSVFQTMIDRPEKRFAEQPIPRGADVSNYYREIAGAQEGTRTPTELPAST